jgi:hypothetical protein
MHGVESKIGSAISATYADPASILIGLDIQGRKYCDIITRLDSPELVISQDNIHVKSYSLDPSFQIRY